MSVVKRQESLFSSGGGTQSEATLSEQFRALRRRITDEDFLANRGLGNEVGFHIFCYDPTQELEVRSLIARLVSDSQQGALACRIIERNLYDVLLEICESKRILEKIPAQEEKKGSDFLLKSLRPIATPEAYAQHIDYEPHQPGDVVFITGVGEVYPLVRLHTILDNLHHRLDDVPVIAFYPGSFTGQSLSLFSQINDGNYYRAFLLDLSGKDSLVSN